MAEDFRQDDDRNNNQKHSSDRNDIVRENKRLLWRVFNLRTRRARRCSQFGWLELGELKPCCRDRWNGGKWDGQRRNGLPRSSGSNGDGVEARSDFGNRP